MLPTTAGRAKCSASRCWAAPSGAYARIGDIIAVAIKEASPTGRVRKGEVAKSCRGAHALRRASSGRLGDQV